MTANQAINRIRYKLDQLDTSNTSYADTEIIKEVNAARREMSRILPKRLFPNLLTTADINIESGKGVLPSNYLEVYPSGYTLIDSVQATMIDPVLLPNLTRNLNTAPGTENKYYFIQAGQFYAFPVTSESSTFNYYAYPADLSESGGTSDVTDLPEDINDIAVELAFAALMSTERGNAALAASVQNDAYAKIKTIIATNQPGA